MLRAIPNDESRNAICRIQPNFKKFASYTNLSLELKKIIFPKIFSKLQCDKCKVNSIVKNGEEFMLYKNFNEPLILM